MVDETLFLDESRRQFARLYQVAYSILRTRQDAEDALQQALMKAWAARATGRPDTFIPWLTRIVVNECRNIQRYRMRVVPSEAPAEKTDEFTPPDIDLWHAIAALPEYLRVPFTLKYVTELTEREVAHATKLPLYTVKNRLKKARKVLRESLTGWEVSFK